ncbi:unnamed protein product [Schistosoma turkestanicum]|nr:unnamed protein product [Schistosoma turkestanicum]
MLIVHKHNNANFLNLPMPHPTFKSSVHKSKSFNNSTKDSNDSFEQQLDQQSWNSIVKSQTNCSTGKYKILRTIGQGNFAKVKLAIHLLTGREVSILCIEILSFFLVSK